MSGPLLSHLSYLISLISMVGPPTYDLRERQFFTRASLGSSPKETRTATASCYSRS